MSNVKSPADALRPVELAARVTELRRRLLELRRYL